MSVLVSTGAMLLLSAVAVIAPSSCPQPLVCCWQTPALLADPRPRALFRSEADDGNQPARGRVGGWWLIGSRCLNSELPAVSPRRRFRPSAAWFGTRLLARPIMGSHPTPHSVEGTSEKGRVRGSAPVETGAYQMADASGKLDPEEAVHGRKAEEPTWSAAQRRREGA